MTKIISAHSFRGGTGKSNIIANVAGLLATEGQRVAVIDTDIQSPGIHNLFGVSGSEIARSLNECLWGKCGIQEVAQDVTANLGRDAKGQLFLIPSSVDAGDIATVVRDGYNTERLADGIHDLNKRLGLDVLMIDTHPGLSKETLLSLVMSHALALILRPDRQDYEGTGVTVKVARQLDVKRIMLIVNKVPAVFNLADVKLKVEQTYGCEVAAVLPHSEEVMALASEGIFALRYPDHPVAATFRKLAAAWGA